MRKPIPFTGAMAWEDWLEMWRGHAALPAFEAKMRQARALAWSGHSKGLMYGSLSGGKDSVALAGLLAECEIDVKWCHAHCEANLPDTLATVDAVADALDLSLDLAEPPEGEPAFQATLEGLEADESLLLPASILPLYRRWSAGSLLTAYERHSGYDGHFDGRRADENERTRGKLFRVRGPVFQYTDGKWSASPLAWWSARDSFALCASRGLPIHPFYRRVAELRLDCERARVDWMFGPWLEGHRVDDTCRAVRWAYPERWAWLARMRPELAMLQS